MPHISSACRGNWPTALPLSAPNTVRFGKNTLYILDYDNTSVHTLPNDQVVVDDTLLAEFDDSDVVVFNTGRPFFDVRDKSTPALLDRADAMVTRDGTGLWYKDAGKQWHFDTRWLHDISGGYQPEATLQTVINVCHSFRQGHAVVIDAYHEPGSPTLLLRTPQEQIKDAFIQKLTLALQAEKLTGYRLLIEDKAASAGFYVIKVLPQNTSKGVGSMFLIQKFLASHPHLQKCFIGGDADNDLTNFLILPPSPLKTLFALVNRHAVSLYTNILQAKKPESVQHPANTTIPVGFHPDLDLFVSSSDPALSPAPQGLREAIRFFKRMSPEAM